MKKKIILLCFVSVYINCYIKNIVFDLNGVLFKNDTLFLLKKITFSNLLLYLIKGNKNPIRLKKDFFTFLNDVFKQPSSYLNITSQDDKGNTLPYVMDAWMNNTLLSKKIIQTCKEYLLHNKQLAPIVKKIYFKLAQLIFNPYLFCQGQILIPEALSLLLLLKANGYKLYVLSNWSHDAFKVIQKKYPELFKLFDGIVISGNVESNKPHKKIYHFLLETYAINPYETVFIDDQPINLTTGSQLGMQTILCPQKGIFFKQPNIEKLQKALTTILNQ